MSEHKDLPLVSVIVPAYNHEKYVAETLSSILSQTYQNIEICIVDDCSKDGTYTKILEIAALKPEVFKISRNEINLGLVKTLNKALKVASGKYVYMIASDDVLASDNVIKFACESIEKFCDEKIAGIAGNLIEMDENGTVKKNFNNQKSCIGSKDQYRDYVDSKIRFSLQACLIKKETLRWLGFLDERFLLDDYPLFLKILRNHTFLTSDFVFCLYRNTPGSLVEKSYIFENCFLRIAQEESVIIADRYGPEKAAYFKAKIWQGIALNWLNSGNYRDFFRCLVESFKCSPFLFSIRIKLLRTFLYEILFPKSMRSFLKSNLRKKIGVS